MVSALCVSLCSSGYQKNRVKLQIPSLWLHVHWHGNKKADSDSDRDVLWPGQNLQEGITVVMYVMYHSYFSNNKGHSKKCQKVLKRVIIGLNRVIIGFTQFSWHSLFKKIQHKSFF